MDQTQPRFLASLDSGPISGVQKILPPDGAYYDEVTLNVPESSAGTALLAALIVAGALAAHRGRRAASLAREKPAPL